MNAFITMGIDIGSAASKAVIVGPDRVLAYSILETGPASLGSAQAVSDSVLKKAGLDMADIAYTVATGYGRINVPFARDVVTEIACHAKGVNHLFPMARTVLDMGGQDCKAIRIDQDGNHVNFVMNDKCAAGTGRFLEIIAAKMKTPLEKIGPLSLEAEEDTKISSVCIVFAQSEVSRHLRRGAPIADILGGVHSSTADRAFGLIKRVGIEAEFVISGGIAKNIGVVRRVEDRVGLGARIAPEPQVIGALGAAIIARERVDAKAV